MFSRPHYPTTDPKQIRRFANAPIGSPVLFDEGLVFPGRTVRAELIELQKADLGRKYARKDRRPLDPPPVTQLKLYEILKIGSLEVEREIIDDLSSFGMVCHVDLFPVPGSGDADRTVIANHATTPQVYPSSPHPSYYNCNAMPPNTSRSHRAHHSLSLSLPSSSALAPQMHAPYKRNNANVPYGGHQGPHYAYQPHPDVVAYFGNYAITESSKCTRALAGSDFVQAASLDHKGNRTLMFIFSDLAVKIEGTFVLRFRVFNVFSNPHGNREDLPILAECFGGSFRIYSTKEFPGLSASTDLTKHISVYGVRLNVRENVRKRRKKNESRAPIPISGQEAAMTAGPSTGAVYQAHNTSPAMSTSRPLLTPSCRYPEYTHFGTSRVHHSSPSGSDSDSGSDSGHILPFHRDDTGSHQWQPGLRR